MNVSFNQVLKYIRMPLPLLPPHTREIQDAVVATHPHICGLHMVYNNVLRRNETHNN